MRHRNPFDEIEDEQDRDNEDPDLLQTVTMQEEEFCSKNPSDGGGEGGSFDSASRKPHLEREYIPANNPVGKMVSNAKHKPIGDPFTQHALLKSF
jgi:hypothetical protein